MLTISEIKAQYPWDWNRLSPQQSAFLTEWISGSTANGRYSPVDAARVAYPRVKNVVGWSSRLMKNKRVARIVGLHVGQSVTQSTLFEVQALVKRSKRKGANLGVLIAPWLRACAALEALVAEEKS